MIHNQIIHFIENEFSNIINIVFSISNYNNLFLNFNFALILHFIIVSMTFTTMNPVVEQKNIPTLLVLFQFLTPTAISFW
jgi:hypothetical protein